MGENRSWMKMKPSKDSRTNRNKKNKNTKPRNIGDRNKYGKRNGQKRQIPKWNRKKPK